MSEQIASLLIGAEDVSDRLFWCKTHRSSGLGVGTFNLLLDNSDDHWSKSSCPAADTEIKIDVAAQEGGIRYPWFYGYLDDADVILRSEKYVAGRKMLELVGRDYGQDLQNKTTWTMDSAKLSVIVRNLLVYGTSMDLGGHGTVPSGRTEIGFDMPNPDTTPEVLCDSNGRAYISDVLTKILQQVNADGYVDHLKKYQLIYPNGSRNSGIVLSSTDINGGLVTDLTYQPVKSIDCKNVIIGFGASRIVDAWTDLEMSKFWEPGYSVYGNILCDIFEWCPRVDENNNKVGNLLTCKALDGSTRNIPQVSTYTGFAIDFWSLASGSTRAGPGALLIDNKLTFETHNDAPLTWGLKFPKFYHWWIPFNWLSTGTIEWSMYVRNHTASYGDGEMPIVTLRPDETFIEPGIELVDTLGNRILYMFGGTYNYNNWNRFSVPVGTEISSEGKIYTIGGWNYRIWDKWVYTNGPVDGKPFNWKVKEMWFRSGEGGLISSIGRATKAGLGLTDYIIFDNLTVPGTQVMAVADHSGHGPAGKCEICGRTFPVVKAREYILPASGVTYQSDLLNMTESVANQRWNQVGTSFVPLKTFSLTAAGYKGLVSNQWNWKPGMNLTLDGSNDWRFVDIEEILEYGAEDTGYKHLVHAKGVPKTFQVNMDQFTYAANPRLGIDRVFRNRLNALEAQGQLWNTST